MVKIKNALGLFDGISCGQVALQRAGVTYDTYYASEIVENSIKITQKNFPNTVQLGDIAKWREWNLENVDLIIGGSPCQGFSAAGNKLNFNDPRSKLFFDFVDVLEHHKPKYFLLENVKMKGEWRDIITEYLGVKPILINSNLVSAQNRPRYYWTNIPNIQQPQDKGIFLKDIIEDNVDEKYYLSQKNKNFRSVATPFALTERRTEEAKKIRREYQHKYGRDFSPRRGKELVARNDGKMNCLTKTYSLKEHTLFDNQNIYRKLTPVECERLQTLPNGYTAGFSDSQRYKVLGDGWTVDVIAHIFRNIR
jgi:DNA-cytosine methyltransferase